MLYLEILDALHAEGRHQEWADLKHSPSIQQQCQIKRVKLANQPFQLNKHSLGIYDVPTFLSPPRAVLKFSLPWLSSVRKLGTKEQPN